MLLHENFVNLKKKDWLILANFRRNSRITLTKLSKRIDVPVSTIFDKLKAFEGSIIQKHTTLIDFKKLGFDLKVYMMLKAENGNKERLFDFLMKNPRVNNVFKVNNGFDFLAEFIFRDFSEFSKYVEKLEKLGVSERKDFFVLEELKRESFLEDPEIIDLI